MSHVTAAQRCREAREHLDAAMVLIALSGTRFTPMQLRVLIRATEGLDDHLRYLVRDLPPEPPP